MGVPTMYSYLLSVYDSMSEADKAAARCVPLSVNTICYVTKMLCILYERRFPQSHISQLEDELSLLIDSISSSLLARSATQQPRQILNLGLESGQ